MAIAGLRGTGTGDWATDERPKNFRELILWRDPNGSAPLTALMAKMKKETTDDPEFAWYEEELNTIRLQASATATTGATSISVDQMDAKNLKAGDFLLVETAEDEAYTAEIVQVSSTPTATNSIAVTRGAASTSAATIANDTWLTKIGSAYAEGVTSPDAASRNPTKYLNYTQIFKDSYELTGTAEQTRFRTGDPVKNDKKRKMFDHSVAQEWAYLFGKKYETTGSNSKPLRYTGGLRYWLATAYSGGTTHCVKLWTTTPTESTMLDAIYKVFDYNTSGGGAGNERIVFAGNGALNRLNKIAKAESSTRINFDGTIRVFGMELQRWILPQGTLYVRTHPLMNTHTLFTKAMFVIDPSNIIYRPMRNRDTKMMDNIQANDADTRKGQWMTEAGVEYHHLKTMQYHGNFDN